MMYECCLEWFRKKCYMCVYKENTHDNKAHGAKMVTRGKAG